MAGLEIKCPFHPDKICPEMCILHSFADSEALSWTLIVESKVKRGANLEEAIKAVEGAEMDMVNETKKFANEMGHDHCRCMNEQKVN